MVALLSVAALVLGCVSGAAGCTKEEYAAHFGASYILETTPDGPVLEAGASHVTAFVSYATPCPEGGSEFTIDVMGGEDFPTVWALKRHEPVCDTLNAPEATWSGRISVPVPAAAKAEGVARYLAFPPDSDLELYLLQERAGDSAASSFLSNTASSSSSSSSTASKSSPTDAAVLSAGSASSNTAASVVGSTGSSGGAAAGLAA